ncbi:MAG TPA: hypothetical protein VH601_16120 [Bryobacteraceae bacterium]|jgi:hypothetical protein
MTGTLLAALSGEEVVLSSPFGMVTTNFVIIRSAASRSQIILSVNRLTEIKTIKTSYPGLLVISTGLFILAAAAMCSKEGSGSGIPMALLASGFLLGYLASRRALLVFFTGSEMTETVSGSLRGAATFRRAVEAARRQLER